MDPKATESISQVAGLSLHQGTSNMALLDFSPFQEPEEEKAGKAWWLEAGSVRGIGEKSEDFRQKKLT